MAYRTLAEIVAGERAEARAGDGPAPEPAPKGLGDVHPRLIPQSHRERGIDLTRPNRSSQHARSDSALAAARRRMNRAG